MKPILSTHQMYGHWIHCNPKVCEFQHGTVMIYVSYGDERPMETRLAKAQESVEATFDEIPYAIEFACKVSQRTNPEFWHIANRIKLRQSPLVVFAIRYPIDSDLPVYEISWNPVFEPEAGLLLSEDYAEEEVQVQELPENEEVVFVKRLGQRRYEHAA